MRLAPKILGLCAAALAAAVVVAGCGGGDEATATPPPAPTATPRAQGTTTPVPAAQRVGSITEDVRWMKYLTNKPNWKDPVQYGGTPVVTNSFNPVHYDPTVTTDSSIYTAVGPVYNRLVRCAYGAEMKVMDGASCIVTPDLAASWEVGADGRTATYKLNKGVKWQNLPPVNGREFTADDVIFTINEYKNAPTFKLDWGIIESATAPDPYTLVVKLNAPFYDINQGLFAYTGVRILPKEIKAQDGDFKKTAVGTGPFILKTFESQTRLVWEKNPTYFRQGLPYLDGMTNIISGDRALQQAAYRAGKIHYSFSATNPTNNSELAALLRSRTDSVSFEGIPDVGTFQIALDINAVPFKDIRVRQALSSAIDHQTIINTIYEGSSDLFPAVPWIWWNDGPPTLERMGPNFKFDQERSKRLLKESGVTLPITMELNYPSFGPSTQLTLEAIKQMVSKVGIEMKITLMPIAAYTQALNSGTFTGATVTYVRTHSGLDGYTYQVLRSDAVRNSWRIKDPKIDRLVDSFRAEPDPAKRRANVVELVDYDLDLLFRIPMPTSRAIWMHDPHLRNVFWSTREIWPYTGAQSWEVMWWAK